MLNIEIYTKNWCPYCHQAKALLRGKGVSYREIDVTTDSERELEMIERCGRRSVPQIFIDGSHLGGFDDLAALQAAGELDQLIDSTRLYGAASDLVPFAYL